jgi:hypothetical protein
VRLFFSNVASQDLECHAVDINSAFVQGELCEETYMRQPPGFEDGTDNVCHIHKSLYGLKQAPRVWNKLLTGFLLSHGFVQSPSDAAIFFLRQPGDATVFLLMYVDDLQIACAALQRVTEVKRLILSHFPGKDLGESSFFLQMSIRRDRASRVLPTTPHRCSG